MFLTEKKLFLYYLHKVDNNKTVFWALLNEKQKGKFVVCLDRKPPQKSDLLRLFLRERHEKTQ